MPEKEKPIVFISYSHKDEKWKNTLLRHLKALENVGHIKIWDDRKIDIGGEWKIEIDQFINKAAVAVCLISADFLASDFISKEEIPCILKRQKEKGMITLPILLGPCPWKAIPWLKVLQMFPRDGKCIREDFKGHEDVPFAEIGENIYNLVTDPVFKLPEPSIISKYPAISPSRIDFTRLPQSGAELFGRSNELKFLTESWDKGDLNIAALVAYGGVGKTTLVNRWLEQMEVDNFCGADRVFGWSFYSQGTGERVTSADQFMDASLRWFGDKEPEKGSAWDKGLRLAKLIREQRTLFILDGLEPLQSEHEKGKIKDPGLSALIRELARNNSGLCAITTRERVIELERFDAVKEKNLEEISAQAGRALLRVSGVRGTDMELEEISERFGNHALTIQLLASWLYGREGHRASHALEIPIPEKRKDENEERQKDLFKAVADALDKQLENTPERELARLMGLFDRPVEEEALKALTQKPALPGLTDLLSGLPPEEMEKAKARARQKKLLLPQGMHSPSITDSHPLIREYYGERLKKENKGAWEEAHLRLYAHYKTTAREYPETLEEMNPLYLAVTHGCKAGKHQEALDEVYWKRVRRGKEAFDIKKLGAYGADLAVLSSFFTSPWNAPELGLTEGAKAFILNEAGYNLRALGRLRAAAEPIEAGLKMQIEQEDWENAAIATSSLSQLFLTAGEIEKSVKAGRQGVELADRSRDVTQKIINMAALADALHQAGEREEAEKLFMEAEDIKKKRQPQYPLLYSLPGYWYCDLLLARGEYGEALRRGEKTLEWAEKNKSSLLTLALDNLTLGRAHLAKAVKEKNHDFRDAEKYLDLAVEWLRKAASQDHIPSGLLARAGLFLEKGELERAETDLSEALEIAEQGGMLLHLADCKLGLARLYLAKGDKQKARESLEEATKIVKETGYHRRDGEVTIEELTIEELRN